MEFWTFTKGNQLIQICLGGIIFCICIRSKLIVNASIRLNPEGYRKFIGKIVFTDYQPISSPKVSVVSCAKTTERMKTQLTNARMEMN